ncbi:MAG: DMT family transporter [Parvularculaceae bacterium]
MSPREFVIFAGMCVVWGFHFVVIKVAVGEIPPLLYAALRMSLVALVMAPFLRWRPGRMAPVFAAGACFGAFNYAFMFSGLKLASASAGAVAMELHVVFATLLSVIFLGERIHLPRITGIALAFSGVILIALGQAGDAAGPGAMLGVVLVACGAMVEATGSIIVKKAKGFRPPEFLAWFAVIGAPILWGMTLVIEDGQGAALAAADKPLLIGAVFYSALLSSVFGHTAYYWLIQRLPISIVAPGNLLTTVLAVAFSIVILGDPFTVRFALGGALTLVGVAIVLMRGARSASPVPVLTAEEQKP